MSNTKSHHQKKQTKQIIREESYQISLTHTKTQRIIKPKIKMQNTYKKTKPSSHDNTSNQQHIQTNSAQKTNKRKNTKKQSKYKKKIDQTFKRKQKEIQIKPKSKKKSTQSMHYSDKSKKQIYLNINNTQKTTPYPTIRMGQPINPNSSLKISALPSYRQYCIIDGEFVPVSNSNDHRFLNSLLTETAATSPQFDKSPFLKSKYLKNDHMQYNTSEIGQLSSLREAVRKQYPQEKQNTEQNSLKVGLKFVKKQLKNQSILVHAAQQEIGIQYSSRRNGGSEERIRCLQNLDKNSCNDNEKQGLKSILKLQNFCESSKDEFQNLTMQQKRKYREILESLITKMQSPRIQMCVTSNTISQDSLIIASLKANRKQEQNQQNFSREIEFLEQNIYAREAKQMGEIVTIIRQNSNQINTSLVTMVNIFENFFCFLEINYIQELLDAINRMYGWSYMDKYRFISKSYKDKYRINQQISICGQITRQISRRENNFTIIKEVIFQQFMKQIMNYDSLQQQQKMYQYFHCHAVFDAINQLLKPYQPFYITKGDAFPWSLSIIQCFTFFSIDQESISIVISEIRSKFIKQICKNLCGIIIQGYRNPEVNIGQEHIMDAVQQYRKERQDKMMMEQLEYGFSGKSSVVVNLFADYQIFVTALFHQISLEVTQILLEDAIKQIKQIF